MAKLSSQNAILFLLLPFAIICNLEVCESKASCNEKDKHILLCFKHGLTDPSGMLSTWSNKEDCCQWSGVQCDTKGRVVNISLRCLTDDHGVYGSNDYKEHCLTGVLHLSLLKLEFLNYLDLSNHNFKVVHLQSDCLKLSLVNTPLVRGNSSNLVYLDLSENDNLVIDDLRWLLRLSSLEYLILDSIDLHRETQWLQILTMLPSLSALSLKSCQLESDGPSLEYANFTSLEYLDLSSNDFNFELPKWLFNLSGLSTLILSKNNFHGQIPNTLMNLRSLNWLDLSGNMLTGTIPYWLGQLGSLKRLYLGENSFIGSIPTTLGNLSSLIDLDISNNHLTGILPESFGQLSNLEVLEFSENLLFGVVSQTNFAKMSKLQTLNMGSPSLKFDFDPHWIPPFQILDLVLGHADLKHLPWLYTQISLNLLEIYGSSFTTESFDKFWNWTANIEMLFLHNNSMPWDMTNVLLNSKVIGLVANDLSRGLPRLTSNVTALTISHSYLSGSLSSLLCHKMNGESKLLSLQISDSFLSEGLSDCWANWKSLVNVYLESNNLTGMIPHSIGTLSNLVSLDLRNNKLHGKIPLSLKNCQKLMILKLAKNKFSGSIPNWMGKEMKALQLRSNEFSSNIPLEICQLSSLIVLDVANNRLTGTIPRCLGDITTMVLNNVSPSDKFGFTIQVGHKRATFHFDLLLLIKGNELDYIKLMRVIDLSSNQLSGKIPSEIFRLTALQSLNLSQNQLRGTIPEEIGNMKQLESLDLSNNNISGEIPQSMSGLSFLGTLNLSFNNFKGQIPSGTQLQSFTALSYIGNPQLCGTPLEKNCTHDEAPNDAESMGEDEKGSELLESFYMGMGFGFAISFWVVCGSLFLIRTWRHAYFRFLNDMKDRLYVKMILKCTPSVEI